MNESNANMDINKLIELQVAFLNFTIKCCPENERLDSVNNILIDCVPPYSFVHRVYYGWKHKYRRH